MESGAYLVNAARAKIVDRDAVDRALRSGQLAGYAGDVRYPRSPHRLDHPWRTLPHHGVTPYLRFLALRAGPVPGRAPARTPTR